MSGAGGPGVLLARHGETDSNREARFQGRLDVPLNATGREQAAALAERVAEAGVVTLWASPLVRARETAEIVGARIGLEPRLDARLVEVDVGEWEGRLYADVAREDAERFTAYQRPAADFRFPGGEALAEQVERVAAALADVRALGPLPALVVCHGGAIRAALTHRDGAPLERWHEQPVPNTALVALDAGTA